MEITKNMKIAISIIVVIILAIILFFVFYPSQSLEDELDMIQSNLGKAEAEQLAINANQDWVVDLQPYYSVEVVNTTLEQGMWTVSLKLWTDEETTNMRDKIGYILDYKVEDATGEVMKNPKRTDLN